MRIIYNRVIPFKGFLAINLFGVLFVRGTQKDITAELLNHERIHSAQMKELGYVFFYVAYILEWLFRICSGDKNAYLNLSFEREAYRNQRDATYLRSRKWFAMWRKPQKRT